MREQAKHGTLFRVSYSLEQLLPRAREAARRVVDYLCGGRRVARLVDDYAEVHGRAALLADADERRELITRLTREALLAMCMAIGAAVPRFLGVSPARRPSPRDEVLADAFRAEFYLHLAKEMHWAPEELELFWRDLDHYSAMAWHPKAKWKGAAAGTFADPLVGRCALLLDASLFAQAHTAAQRFHGELAQAAGNILKSVFPSAKKIPSGLFARNKKR